LTCNFDDLEPAQFKAIQCQKSLCQSMPIDGFLYDLYYVQHCVSHGIRDI